MSIAESVARGEFPHLDHWRIKPLADSFAFGPVHLAPRFRASAAAFLRALAPTPKHGMLWSDAEAQGFIGAQISREASRAVRHINEPFRAAVRERSGSDRYVGALVRSCTMHGKGTPMCIVIQSGVGWMEAFLAAIEGGITKEEVARLNEMTGLRLTKAQLKKRPIHTSWCNRDMYVDWKGRSADEPLSRALMAQSLINGDTPFDWGTLQLTFGWGWLQSRKRYAEACEKYLGASAMKRLGFVRKTTTSWDQSRPA